MFLKIKIKQEISLPVLNDVDYIVNLHQNKGVNIILHKL